MPNTIPLCVTINQKLSKTISKIHSSGSDIWFKQQYSSSATANKDDFTVSFISYLSFTLPQKKKEIKKKSSKSRKKNHQKSAEDFK